MDISQRRIDHAVVDNISIQWIKRITYSETGFNVYLMDDYFTLAISIIRKIEAETRSKLTMIGRMYLGFVFTEGNSYNEGATYE